MNGKFVKNNKRIIIRYCVMFLNVSNKIRYMFLSTGLEKLFSIDFIVLQSNKQSLITITVQ